MIEFGPASLAENPEDSDLWQGLNAASVALQQSAQSETAVYQVFSEQLIKLGLHGSVNILNESGDKLRVAAMVFSERLMRFINRTEKLVNVKAQDFTYPVRASQADASVLTKGNIVFLPDNSEKMQQVIPPHIFRFADKLLKPFIKVPAILAPLFAKSEVIGVLYIAGTRLRVEDVPAISAFATYFSIALENARLFQAMQEAVSQYQHLFESANDGIFLFDQNSRQLISANPKMLSLLGIEADEVGVIRPSSWATPNVYRQYSENFEIALKKGSHVFDAPFIDRHGNEHQWQISATIVELNGKPVVNGVVRDITTAKKAEEVLRQREEQFRILAENVPGTIYLCKNEPRFSFLYVNNGIEDLTGYPKEQFILQERFLGDLIHPDDRAQFDWMLSADESVKDQAFRFMYRLQHRSGTWRWVEDVGGGVFDEQGNLLFLEGIISDITERVQSELLQNALYHIAAVAHTNISLDELYISIHESLAPILNVKNFYIALYDAASDTITVPYFVDEYDERPTVYEASHGLTEFVIRTNSPQLLTRQQIEDYFKQGFFTPQGTMPQSWLGVPLQSHEMAIGVLAVQDYEEVTAYSEQDKQFLVFVSEQIASVIARKQAEERQRQLSTEITQQKRLLEAILLATPDNFLVFDLDGRFLFVSSKIVEYLNIPSDLVVGKTWQELQFPPEFGRLSDEDRATVLQTGKPVTREFQFPLSDKMLEIEFVTNPVLSDEGEVISFVTTARDMTEQRQTMRIMHRTQKLESLGILAGGIAHDFNNLLVAMMGQASIAQTHLAQTHPAYAHVNKAVQAAEQAANLTRQLLAYSGGGQFTISTLNLNTLIAESAELLKVALPKQVELALSLAHALPLIEADMAQLQQVMMNLLINAAEAMNEQPGTIRIRTAVRHVTEQDSIFWRYTNQPLAPDKYVSLCVKDSGDGMENETIAKIFDPFFTTKFTGRGLGLAAVLGIVRSHRGGLHVASNPGEGTSFELLFPISAETAVASSTELDSNGDDMSGMVLVIDDEAPVREAVVDILELEGIDVLTAANGDAGIALYKAQAHKIDLIILDLSMPGKSGRETFEELVQADPNVRILLSSGYSEADATRGFASPPLVGFLQKPYRLDTFVKRLQKYLRQDEE